MQTDRIRRRSKDTVAIDSHRQETLFLRARTRRRFFNSGRLSLAWRLLGAAAILVAYVAFLPRTPVPPGASAMLISAKISPMPE